MEERPRDLVFIAKLELDAAISNLPLADGFLGLEGLAELILGEQLGLQEHLTSLIAINSASRLLAPGRSQQAPHRM